MSYKKTTEHKNTWYTKKKNKDIHRIRHETSQKWYFPCGSKEGAGVFTWKCTWVKIHIHRHSCIQVWMSMWYEYAYVCIFINVYEYDEYK